MKRFVPSLLMLLLALALPCAASEPAPDRVTVFAAASLKESLDEAGKAWTRRSGQQLRVSYAASSALARQIEQGAPADVFISADGEWMDYLEQRDLLVEASRFDLVGNRLVLVVPSGSTQGPLSPRSTDQLLAALGDGGRLAVAETTAVPAGRYARAALERTGGWERLTPRLAQAENVRAALAFVARGEAPLGIVYATDAQAEPKVRVVATFDAADHPAIVYPAAALRPGHVARAEGLLAFLRGEEARAIFVRYGFTTP